MIFDCDGVLVDSEPIGVRIEREVLAELGWELDEAEIVERFLGRTSAYMRAEVERHVGRSLPDLDARLESRSWEAFRREVRPIAGIEAALERISIPTCVASSGSHEKMALTLGVTGLRDRFDGRIFSALEVEHGKPAPDLFLHAAERMGVAPSACAVVEDSRFGVEAARCAGMRAFGYAGGLTPGAWLTGPDTVVFDDMRELPGLLAEG